MNRLDELAALVGPRGIRFPETVELPRNHAADLIAGMEALAWIAEFAAKMSDRHTGFVHVERRARAGLAPFEERS